MERDPIADARRQWSANEDRWRGYQYTPSDRLLILTEEIGEIARSMQGEGAVHQWPPDYTARTYHEIIDAMAVLLPMAYECMARVK